MKKILTVLCFICLIALASIIVLKSAKTSTYNFTTVHVVSVGETLWGISDKYNPQIDNREVIYEIKKLNNCSSFIIEGQELKIPIYDT